MGYTITAADLAQRWGLVRQDSKGTVEYIGRNPWPEENGANDDGFVLTATGSYKGTAKDRSLNWKTYSSKWICQREGIDYWQYEGSDGDTRTQAPKAPKPLPVKELQSDTRDLRQRGLGAEAIAHFRISYHQGNDRPNSWGAHWTWPTYNPDGTPGRVKRKYQYPNRQLDSRPDRKPRKTDWDTKTKDLPIPCGYNIHECLRSHDVWLVNSELAVWLFWQEDIAAICPLGEHRIKENYALMFAPLKASGTRRICVLLDNDKAGKESSVNACDAALEVGLQCTVYDLTAAGKTGYDASDLYEWWASQPAKPRKKFTVILAEQEEADAGKIEVWREGTQAYKKAQEHKKSSAEFERHLDELGRVEAKPSAGDKALELLEMVRSHQLFRSNDGKTYIVVEHRGHKVPMPIESDEFGDWCRYLYLRAKNSIVGPDTVKNAAMALRALANMEAPIMRSHVRTAMRDERLYIDLCNDEYEVVEVDAQGWRVVNTSTTATPFFRRPAGMLPLPRPEQSEPAATWQAFRDMVNIGEDRNFILLVSWMIFAMIPPGQDIDCPVLSVHGQQGSAKTVMCRIARNTIDPNEGDMVSYVKEEKDVVIAAENGRVFCLDNLTTMPVWLSNLLSAMVTGTPYRCRTLYTDNGSERFYKGQPALIVNGIPDVIGGKDFNDRILKLNLPTIADKGYRSKRNVLAEWRGLHGRLLGAICTAISAGIRHRDRQAELVNGRPLSRMSDFLLFMFGAEVDGGLPWPMDSCYNSVVENVQNVSQLNLDDLLAQAVILMLSQRGGEFEGIATDLYNHLFNAAVQIVMDQDKWIELENSTMTDDQKRFLQNRLIEDAKASVRHSKDFPGGRERLGVEIKKIAPALTRNGISTAVRPTNKGSLWKIKVEHFQPLPQTTKLKWAGVDDPFDEPPPDANLFDQENPR